MIGSWSVVQLLRAIEDCTSVVEMFYSRIGALRESIAELSLYLLTPRHGFEFSSTPCRLS